MSDKVMQPWTPGWQEPPVVAIVNARSEQHRQALGWPEEDRLREQLSSLEPAGEQYVLLDFLTPYGAPDAAAMLRLAAEDSDGDREHLLLWLADCIHPQPEPTAEPVSTSPNLAAALDSIEHRGGVIVEVGGMTYDLRAEMSPLGGEHVVMRVADLRLLAVADEVRSR